MKNYDEELTDLWYKTIDFLNNFWWNFLDFIFSTKMGHLIFNMVIAMVVMGFISLFFSPERRLSILIGAFVGAFATSLFFAWKDNNETWF